MNDKTDKQIAALSAEVDRLKASQPTTYDAAAAARWRDEMHQMRERRASACLPFSAADLDAMRAAAPDHVVKSIALRDARAPMGPSSAGTSGQLTKTSSNAGMLGSNTSGWAREIPLSPPPGVQWVDALYEVDSARQRGTAMVAEARQKAAEEKP
jgi:hypothetical protein